MYYAFDMFLKYAYLTIAIAIYMYVIIIASYMHVSNLRTSKANLSINL